MRPVKQYFALLHGYNTACTLLLSQKVGATAKLIVCTVGGDDDGDGEDDGGEYDDGRDAKSNLNSTYANLSPKR